MVASLAIVVNPAAGGGRAIRHLPAVRTVLDAAGARYLICQSSSLGHARAMLPGCGVTPVMAAGWLPHPLTGHYGRGNDSAYAGTPDGDPVSNTGRGPDDGHIGADQRLAA